MRRIRERYPDRILRHAVHGMLPKNRTRRVREDRLVLLTGEDHPHHGQVAATPYKLVAEKKAVSGSGMPSVEGYFINLVDEPDNIVVEATPYVPENIRKKLEEKKRKANLHKQLRAYLLGRSERPDFLPQPPAPVANKK